jgi:tetratricopeptide (TPR) repeat protein
MGRRKRRKSFDLLSLEREMVYGLENFEGLFPDLSASSRCSLAKSLIEQGEYAEATQNLLRAIELNPRDPEAHLFLGVCYGRTTQWQEAAESFCETLRLDPNNHRTKAYLEEMISWMRQHEVISISWDDIKPGTVLFLDTDILATLGGSFTTDGRQRVRGRHFFLCVITEPEYWSIWFPLFSRNHGNRIEVSSVHKEWRLGTAFLYPYQYWRAPFISVLAAEFACWGMPHANQRNFVDEGNLQRVINQLVKKKALVAS